MASIKIETEAIVTPNGTNSSSRDDEKPTGSTQAPAAVPGETKPQPRGSELPVVNNVFYNEETLKYMKIIDMYKKLGVGKHIELPRVRNCPTIT